MDDDVTMMQVHEGVDDEKLHYTRGCIREK